MHKVILVIDHYICKARFRVFIIAVDDLSVLKGFKDGATFLSYLKTMKDRTSFRLSNARDEWYRNY